MGRPVRERDRGETFKRGDPGADYFREGAKRELTK